jgi:hypothetical protein
MMSMDETALRIARDAIRAKCLEYFEKTWDYNISEMFAATAIRAYLSAAQPAPGVRELEWHSDQVDWWAYPYRIRKDTQAAPDLYIVSGWQSGANPYRTLKAAKAAAQADFEARIRSALLPTPQPVERPREPVGDWRIIPRAPNWEMLERLRELMDGDKDFEVVADALEYVLSVAPQPEATPPSPAQGTVERAEPTTSILEAVEPAAVQHRLRPHKKAEWGPWTDGPQPKDYLGWFELRNTALSSQGSGSDD